MENALQLEMLIVYLCMVGRMKSMEAMKPFTKFMMVLKMYTKECLQCVYEQLSLLNTGGPILWMSYKQRLGTF